MTAERTAITRRAFLGAIGAAALGPRTGFAHGAFPTRPPRLVVPFPPGGNGDLVARLFAERIAETLGQPVQIEFRPGASATLGAEAVARSAPDGYTLLLSNNLSIATAPLMLKQVPYRPMEDFVHLFGIAAFANALVVRSRSPDASLGDFIARAKARPGALTYGSAGVGSAGHLTGELLAGRAGIDIVHVPYRGVAPALADLLAGQIDAMFDGLPTATPHARAGRTRLLAVSSGQRAAGFPDTPAISEAVPGVAALAWFGVSAPAATAADACECLERDGPPAVANPDMRARLLELGMLPLEFAGARYARFIEEDIRNWTPIVRAVRARGTLTEEGRPS
jgi:tripartite-type tricarboxylate transporter receptor subunit TctC